MIGGTYCSWTGMIGAAATPRKPSRPVTGLFHQPKICQNALHLGSVIFQKRGELSRRLVEISPLALGYCFFPGWARNHLCDGIRQRFQVGVTNPRRSHEAAPVEERDIDALFLEGRYIDARQALLRGYGECPHLSIGEEGLVFPVTTNTNGDMAAQD